MGVLRSLILCGCINFIGAVEYSVVMPSLWTYLQSFGATESYYGLCLACFSAAKIIATPFFGWWSDRAPLSHVLLASLVLGAGGNMLYATATSKWAILGGRMISGVGAANGPVIFAYISRVTSDAQRTRVVAIVAGVGLIAIAAGPALNIGLARLDFYVGPLHVTETTSVGYCMAALLILLFLSVLILFRNPPQVAPDVDSEEQPPLLQMLREAITLPLLASYLTLFSIGFAQSCFETMLTPVTSDKFGWDIVDNSYVFAAVAGEVALLTIGVVAVAGRVSDRYLVMFGSTWVLVSMGFVIWFWGPGLTPEKFFIPLGVILIGNPTQGMPNRALFSKMTDPRYQGFYQSGMSLVRSVSNIFGPLWGGFALKRLSLRGASYGLLAIMACQTALYIYAFRHMKPTGMTVETMNEQQKQKGKKGPEDGYMRVPKKSTPRTPLLAEGRGRGAGKGIN